MLPASVFPIPEIVSKSQSKTEMYCLGFNKCYDCLTLTNYQYVTERIAKEEKRLRSHSVLTSLNSSTVTFSEIPNEQETECLLR